MRLSELATLASLSERRPPTAQSVIYDLLPALVCFYTTAVLVLLPRTFAIRLAILPITLWSAFRATTLLDISFGNQAYSAMNQNLTVFMVAESFRACIWTFRLDPYTRSTSNERQSPSQPFIWFDAFDLLCNLRGIGWSWPQGLRIPKETRNTTSTKYFLSTTLQWLIRDLVVVDCCHYTVQAMLSKSNNFNIFDASLPPILRYTRSTIITVLSGIAFYLGIDIQYNLVALIAIIVFRQHPSLWPPISDKPYNSTSLNQFWSIRWHQSFRDIFISCGGAPAAYFFGRAGGLLGAFLVSGILHDIGCWGMGQGTDIKSVSGFFIMNAVGVILERVYKTMTGKRVEGVAGLIWTYTWLIGWGGFLINAWFERGLAETRFWPVHVSPAFYAHRFLLNASKEFL